MIEDVARLSLLSRVILGYLVVAQFQLNHSTKKMKIKSLLKYLLKKVVSPVEVNQNLTNLVCNTDLALTRLANLGFKPNHIFDIGAYQGDFAKSCIDLWPDTKVACFEVIPHKVSELKKLASSKSSIQVFSTLLGANCHDEFPFYQLESDAETASSVLNTQLAFKSPPQYYPMSTVDEIVKNHFAGHSPDLLKIDVQGYELEVLKGTEKTLNQIQVILAEINLLEIYKDAPLLAELIAWLDARNWVTYDICSFWRRPLDQALWQSDFIFVQRDSFLRANKNYSLLE